MLKKLAAIGLTTGALVLAAPLAASAAPLDDVSFASTYADTPNVSVDDPSIGTCEETTVVFGPGYFLPGEVVTVTITGPNAADASYRGNVANDDGSMTIVFHAPSDGAGVYSVNVEGSRSYSADLTVTGSCTQDPGVAGDEGLAVTGADVPGWLIAGGAAALLAGGALVVAGTRSRRQA